MFAALSVDGEPTTIVENDSSIHLEIDPDSSEPEYRCRACDGMLVETASGCFETEDHWGEICPESADDEGPHDPEPIALAWCNGAHIATDAARDSVTVGISVEDPRGAFTLTIRRVPVEAPTALAGCLVMHMPHPGAGMAHAETHALHPGTVLVGHAPTLPTPTQPTPAT